MPKTKEPNVTKIFVSVIRHGNGSIDIEAASRSPVPVESFAYGVQINRDPGSGQPTGKRHHQPVVITKRWDPFSIQLYQAAYQNETLPTVLFEFFDDGADGEPRLDHSVKLTNAAIDSVAQSARPETADIKTGELQEVLTIAFLFQSIEILSVDSGLSARDSG